MKEKVILVGLSTGATKYVLLYRDTYHCIEIPAIVQSYLPKYLGIPRHYSLGWF